MTSDLPSHVRAVKDRHGKTRYRFRRKGWKSAYLPGLPGSAEMHRAYAEILEAGPQPEASAAAIRAVTPRSIDDLILKHRSTMRWRKKGERTRYVEGRILERFANRLDPKGRRLGERPVISVSVVWLENIFAGMHETPAAANVLRKVLKQVLDQAIRLEWRTDNPAKLTDSYASGKGHHTWTDAEIDQYRARHPLGTMARLAMELALNTAARLHSVTKIERDMIVNGRITTAHAKDNNEASVTLLATTQAALDALPAAPIRFLITTVHGKPYTVDGFGNKMRQWCDEAGLPHCSTHGLRKACARRLAEHGATDAEGQAVTGHKKSETFAYYRAAANRTNLASAAMARLEPQIVQPTVLENVQPLEKDSNSDA